MPQRLDLGSRSQVDKLWREYREELESVEKQVRAGARIPNAEGYEERLDYLGAYRWYLVSRVGQGDRIDVAATMRGIEQRRKMAVADFAASGRDLVGGGWTFLGPRNLDHPYQTYWGPPPVSGRVNAVAYDPQSPSTTFYAAGAAGGVWKTTDGGANWTPLSDDWDILHASSIEVHPTNPNTLWVGTGDFHGWIPYGIGIMKSSDGGQSWTNVGRSQMQDSAVSDILVDPVNPNFLYATTGRGSTWYGKILRSTNGGDTWSISVNQSVAWQSLSVAQPNAQNQRAIYAAGVDGNGTPVIRRSLNQGASWTSLSSPGGSSYSIAIAASKTLAQRVYLLVPGSKAVYRSDNAGQTWTNITAGFPNGTSWNPDYTWSQAWYNWFLDTTKTAGGQDVVVVGNIDVAVSRDAGNSWDSIGGPTWTSTARTHNDQHSVAIHPALNDEFLIGNDGGAYRVRWIEGQGYVLDNLNALLGITQFYSIDAHPTDAAWLIGGTQDNATPVARSDLFAWNNVVGGDGAGVGIDPQNPSWQYGQYQYNSSSGDSIGLARTANGWSSYNYRRTSAPNESQPFIGVLTLDPGQPKDVYIGGQYLYRLDGSVGDGNGWSNRLGGTILAPSSTISAISIAPSNSNVIYVGSHAGDLWRSADRGNTWTDIRSGTTSLPGQGIRAISVSPTDPNSIVVALSGWGNNVWICSNPQSNARTWTSRSGNGNTALPTVPANDIERDPWAPSTHWFVATDLGVFHTDDAGLNWYNATAPYGLPNVVVNALDVEVGTMSLVAGTFGRGAWRLQLSALPHHLQSLEFLPQELPSGQQGMLRVLLDRVAPPKGLVVELGAEPTGIINLPASVEIGAGQTSVDIPINAPIRNTDATVTVTGIGGGHSRQATLTIKAPAVQSVSLTPSTVVGGNPFEGTVTLKAPAPAGGVSVQLSSSNTGAATVPTEITVPAGATQATFNGQTFPTQVGQNVIVKASLLTGEAQATLFVGAAQSIDVSGQLDLGQYFGDKSKLVAEVRLINDQGSLVSRFDVTLGADGSFAFGTQAKGQMRLQIKVRHWLRAEVPVNLASSNVSGLALTLPNGDINEDNVVDLDDYFDLADAFRSEPGDAEWNANADLDGSGKVDLDDYFILAANYRTQGVE